LQGRPQDVPAGQFALAVALVTNFLTYLIAASSQYGVGQSIILAIADLCLTGLCLYCALAVVDKRARFEQAFTALTGATAVLNLAVAPVLWLSSMSEPQSVGLSDLAILLWGLAILAHVLRHSLEVAQMVSIGLAVAFYLVVVNLMAATGVINTATRADQQLSNFQSFSADWSSKA